MISPTASAAEDGFSLIPEWSAPKSVRALSTMRAGGVSDGPWGRAQDLAGGLNLGAHCGDCAQAVAANRALLRSRLPADPVWLEQVHGVEVFDADPSAAKRPLTPPRADAAVATQRGVVLAVLTADCLPVLITNASGTVVGAAHAGWRGLCAGVLEATITELRHRSADHRFYAWLGPAIGPERFEVGDEVRQAFIERDPGAAVAFRPGDVAGKWFADLFALARQRLGSIGVEQIFGGGLCTASDSGRFYSYRRDRTTGRMASLIWIA